MSKPTEFRDITVDNTCFACKRPPTDFNDEDVGWLRRMSFTTLDRAEAESHQEWLQSFLVRIAALLPEKR